MSDSQNHSIKREPHDTWDGTSPQTSAGNTNVPSENPSTVCFVTTSIAADPFTVLEETELTRLERGKSRVVIRFAHTTLDFSQNGDKKAALTARMECSAVRSKWDQAPSGFEVILLRDASNWALAPQVWIDPSYGDTGSAAKKHHRDEISFAYVTSLEEAKEEARRLTSQVVGFFKKGVES